MLNESQHKLMANEKVQMILAAFDCQPVDRNEVVRNKISARCDKLLQEARSNASAPKVEANPESVLKREETVSTWIQEQRKQNGPSWVPFCIAVLVSVAVGLTWRQAAAYSPVFAQVGQSKTDHRGASLLFSANFEHNAIAETKILLNYSGNKHLFDAESSNSKFYLAEF